MKMANWSHARPDDFKSVANYSSIFKYNPINEPLLENHDAPIPEAAPSRWIRYGVCLLCYLFLVITFPATGFFCLKKIPALERLVVFRLGILQKVRGPGWAIVFPWVDRSIKVDLQPLHLALLSQQLLTSDGAILEACGGQLDYRVCDVVKSVTQVRELDLQKLTLLSLVNIVSGMEQIDIQGKPTVLETAVLRHVNQSTLAWGLEVTAVKISAFVVRQEAQANNGVSQVVSAIQSALGLPDSTHSSLTATTMCNSEQKDQVLLEIVSKALANVPTMKTTLQFHIEDENLYLFCTSQVGVWQISESSSPNINADVCVRLARDVLLKILTGSVTIMQAVSQVKITGDPSILAQFVAHLG